MEDGAAELEEVVLGKEGWFDVEDNVGDTQPNEWQIIRLMLMSDMDLADVNGSLLQCFFIGSLYGTMIGKIFVEEAVDHEADGEIFGLVGLEPVLPWHFVIDTSINKPGQVGLSQALGMAHRLPLPIHLIRDKQNDLYFETPLEEDAEPSAISDIGNKSHSIDLSAEQALVTEYHGKVPQKLFDAAVKDAKEAPEEIDSRDMVEAVVTYVNDRYLLAVRENTNPAGLRAFVAAPWDVIPGQFWGRGIGEKAFPAQKVLDIFLRGQVDAMRYHVYPIMGINSNRVPPRANIVWGPGAEVRVQGNPAEAFAPMVMPPAGQGTFQMSATLERHITQATGVTPDAGRGEQTLGGTSAIRGGFLKRMNRTIRLVSKNFLVPFIKLYYSTQSAVNADQYPNPDFTFRVRTAAGLVAREHENQTLAEMLQFMPPGTPGFWATAEQIIQNTSAKDKKTLIDALRASVEALNQPDPAARLDLERKVVDKTEVEARTVNKQVDTALKAQELVNKSEERPNGQGSNSGAGQGG
ncbi:MAG: portal protein [Acidiferrobacterales bacterium]